MGSQPCPPPSREPAVAEPVAPIVLRLPTADDPTLLGAALTVPDRVAAWLRLAGEA
jgi:hypothetical protein